MCCRHEFALTSTVRYHFHIDKKKHVNVHQIMYVILTNVKGKKADLFHSANVFTLAKQPKQTEKLNTCNNGNNHSIPFDSIITMCLVLLSFCRGIFFDLLRQRKHLTVAFSPLLKHHSCSAQRFRCRF